MLNRVVATNFGLYKELDLDLKKRGLVWVSGENRDSRAASSNGSGKSTISKAITWGLYGKVIDPSARNDEIGDNVIHQGAKTAEVIVYLANDWSISRTRSKGKPGLHIYDELGSEWHGGDIQAKIIEMVGLDFDGFKNTCLFGQNDATRFASPELSDQQRKSMLHRLLRTEVLGVCVEKAKLLASERKKQLYVLESNIKSFDSKIEATNVLSITDKLVAWEAERSARADEARTQVEELKRMSKLALSSASEVPGLKEAQARLQVELDRLRAAGSDELLSKMEKIQRKHRDNFHELHNKIKLCRKDIAHCDEQLGSLEGDACEVCGSDLTDGAPKEKIEKLSKTIEESKAQIAGYLELIAVEEKKLEVLKTRIHNENERCRKIIELDRDIDEIQAAISKTDDAVADAKAHAASAKDHAKWYFKIKEEKNPWEPELSEARKRVKAWKKEKAVEEAAHRVAKEELDFASFWVKGFGAQGLQSFVLDEPMPYLTERANKYLETLSDGDIEVEFKTQRALKSGGGALKEELQINWTIEGVANKTPSGGQQRKIEIATDFAFMDLAETREGASLDLFIADEILDDLDSEGQDRVLQLLQDLRKRRGTIIVISHSATISELFEHSITVVKEGGVARIEEET